VYVDFRARRECLVQRGNVDFPGVAPLLQLTFDVSRPLRSAGDFVALASKDPEGMEARIARLESDVAHIRSDVAELKTDVRSLRDRTDTLRDKIDELRDKMDARFDKLHDSLVSAQVWALLLYIVLAAANFGALARGFGWI
jgi:uncharacterized coiled-coil protein SlyX